jgi:hypothetical protein
LPSRAQASNDFDIGVDGGTITRAVTLPRDFPLPSDWTTDAATMVHETGHTFSLPDLYDNTTFPIGFEYFGRWDPMSSQVGRGSDLTNEFTGWHLWRLGWVDDDQVTCLSPTSRMEVTLDALTRHGSSVIAVIPTGGPRAVVLESRKAERFNSGIAKPGVLVSVIWTDTRSGFGPVYVGPRDGTGYPTDSDGFDDVTLAVGDRYTDPTIGFTVTVVDSTDASDTVRIVPAGAPTEPPVEPTDPTDPGTDPAGASPTTLPPTGHDPTLRGVLAVGLLMGGALATGIARATRRRGGSD